MTLELNKVSGQIEEMGRVLAERAGRQRHVLPAARELLRIYANDLEELCRVARSDAGQQLHCASPGDEPLDSAHAAPAMPAGATLIAADGSQIYPDRHGMAFYYVINVGTVIFRHGSGQAPRIASQPTLCYSEEKVFPDGNLVSSDLVATERNVAELGALTELVLVESGCGPACLGLIDGPLLLWLGRTAVPAGEQHRLREAYLGCLEALKSAGTAIAGFVSRPQSNEVLALLYLRHLEPEERRQVTDLHNTPYRGVTDRALFSDLKPGERSALFSRGTPENATYEGRGHRIDFFYLNTGSDVARVEVPEWVVGRPEVLNLVQAAVFDQCRFNNGYPYVLTRADEQAVIMGDEREAMEDMLIQAMLRHGLPLPEFSRKAQQKQVARWRRPH